MTDEELTTQWSSLDPTQQQKRTIQHRVFAWLEADQTSLAAQWIALFKIRPITVLGYATVNVLSILPISWLAAAMFAS